MLSQSQSSLNHMDFQARFDHQRAQFKILIDWFVPCWFTDRRNGNNTKLADEDLLALMCLKVHYQLTTWMALYRLVKHALPELAMIEYSRFTRRIKQLGPVLQAIRQGLLSWTTPGSIAIIDSYPLPLCQYVRNFHACAFAGYADIGYNATKKQHFYGFKVHMAVTPSGLILNYVVTPASVSDVKVALTVTQGCPCPNILADVGYVSKDLRAEFARRGYNFWTPYRSNMKGAKEHNNPTLKRTRRLIETTFAKLTAVGSEQTCTRSLAGLRAQIESIILAHNLEILGNGNVTN